MLSDVTVLASSNEGASLTSSSALSKSRGTISPAKEGCIIGQDEEN